MSSWQIQEVGIEASRLDERIRVVRDSQASRMLSEWWPATFDMIALG